MNKGKLCSLAIAGMIGFLSISPVTTFAAELDTESVTQTENNKVYQDKQSAFKEKMKKASEKWKTLSDNQKEEVYALLQQKTDVESKLADKLAELGIFEKEDAEKMKSHMLERFNKLKDSGEFPFQRHKDHKRSK